MKSQLIWKNQRPKWHINTECIVHYDAEMKNVLHKPQKSFQRYRVLLKSGSLLGTQTMKESITSAIISHLFCFNIMDIIDNAIKGLLVQVDSKSGKLVRIVLILSRHRNIQTKKGNAVIYQVIIMTYYYRKNAYFVVKE